MPEQVLASLSNGWRALVWWILRFLVVWFLVPSGFRALGPWWGIMCDFGFLALVWFFGRPCVLAPFLWLPVRSALSGPCRTPVGPGFLVARASSVSVRSVSVRFDPFHTRAPIDGKSIMLPARMGGWSPSRSRFGLAPVTGGNAGDILDLIFGQWVGHPFKTCPNCHLFGSVRAFWLEDGKLPISALKLNTERSRGLQNACNLFYAYFSISPKNHSGNVICEWFFEKGFNATGNETIKDPMSNGVASSESLRGKTRC